MRSNMIEVTWPYVHYNCITTALLWFKTKKEMLPQKAFFVSFYTCCIHQKARPWVKPSLYTLQWHWCSVLRAVIRWCNCSENLKRKVEWFRYLLLPALGHVPDCLTKNLLFIVMVLYLFSVSFLSENPFVIKKKKLPNCTFWQRIMQNSWTTNSLSP